MSKRKILSLPPFYNFKTPKGLNADPMDPTYYPFNEPKYVKFMQYGLASRFLNQPNELEPITHQNIKRYLQNEDKQLDIDQRQFAMIGRSNVGKSSLINSICQRSLAQTSKSPGRTRIFQRYSFTFKKPNDIVLVDCPGYGYASVAKSQLKQWRFFTKEYFEKVQELNRTIVLIDSRIGIQEIDDNLFQALNQMKRQFAVVLTKCDQLTDLKLLDQFLSMGQHLGKYTQSDDIIFATSSSQLLHRSGYGVAELSAFISYLLFQN